MTRVTYNRHNNKRLDKVIAKFGYEHPATIAFAEHIETFTEPTVENDMLLNNLMWTTLKYGQDLQGEQI